MNPKHHKSDTPCKRCGGRIRYTSTRNCVHCAKTAMRRRRGLPVEGLPPADAPDLDDGSDLIGDLE